MGSLLERVGTLEDNMAFIDQVQDLTSLTVSDNGELSQFLSDETTGKIEEARSFCRFRLRFPPDFTRVLPDSIR